MEPLILILKLLATIGLLFYMLFRRLPRFPASHSREFVELSRKGPVAHRAGRPENTLTGIRKACEEGASGVEVDLAFTKDGVPVLLHDRTIDRTSNGSGKLSELTFQEVRKFDFGCKNGAEFSGECIPTLDEALELCEELDMQVYLEVKKGHNKAVAAIINSLRQSPARYKQVAVVSFCPLALYKLRRADPNINCGLLTIGAMQAMDPQGKLAGKSAWSVTIAPYIDTILKWSVKNWLLKSLGISMLMPQKDQLLTGVIEPPIYWEKRDISLVTWTVNKKEEKDVFQKSFKIAYLSDCVDPKVTVPEQFQLHKHLNSANPHQNHNH